MRPKKAYCCDCGKRITESVDNKPIHSISLGYWCDDCNNFKNREDVKLLKEIKSDIKDALNEIDIMDEIAEQKIANKLGIKKESVSFTYGNDSCYCTINLDEHGVWVSHLRNEGIKIKEVYIQKLWSGG